jgi:hypothetical protein
MTSSPSYRTGEKALTKSGINTVLDQFMSPDGVGVLSPARYEIYIASNIVGKNKNWMQRGLDDSIQMSMFNRFPQNAETMKRLSKSCEAASLPGRSVSTQPNRISGPVREMPYESLYSGDLDLTFRLGTDMFERKFFEFWMDQVIDHNTHRLSYYDNYTRDIYIAQLGVDDSIVYKVILKECYPKAINAIDLGFDKTDEYEKQSVSIAFREYIPLTQPGRGSEIGITSLHESNRSDIRSRQARSSEESARRRASAHSDLIGSVLADADRRLGGA